MTMERALNFAWPVTAMAYEDYRHLSDLMTEKAELFAARPLTVFGAGIRGSLFAAILEKLGYNDFSFVDNNRSKWGGFINAHPIEPPETLSAKKGRNVVIISTEDCDGIRRQLTAEGWRENYDFFAVQTREYDNYVDEFAKSDPVDCLVMGDCGLSQISLRDRLTDSLGVMLQKELGQERTKVLAMHGMGMRSYYNIFKWQLEAGLRPSTLLMMVNFEIFTGRHHLLPRTQHAPLFQKISALDADHPEKETYARLTEERSRELIADVASASAADGDNARLVLKMNYMYRLREGSEDLEYMAKLFALARENSVRVIPFIPPVNHVYAAGICGPEFMNRYQANLEKMKGLISQHSGLEVLDLSFILGDDGFANPTTIDETANHDGRTIVLRHMLDRLRRA